VLLISTSFTALAKHQAKTLGMPGLPTVVLPHPIGGTPVDSVLAKVDKACDEILAKLTTPLAREREQLVPESGERHEVPGADEWTDLQREMMKLGWGDGLPMVPPTERRVAAMVAGSGMAAEQAVAVVAPKMGVATVELIGAAAVMAGCRPQHMPLLIAAVQAMAEPQFNLYGCQATTHCVAPLLIVNGPLAEALNINSGSGCFGPGPWDNGVVGRAIRLILLNIGGAVPGEIDKATMGHPGKFSFCIAENEAANPWPSLRAQRGFADDVSTVTVVGGEAPHNINDHEAVTAGGVLTTICGAMAQSGQNTVYYTNAEPLLILGPEHAATIAREGLSKEDVQRAVFEDARIPITRFGREVIERRLHRRMGHKYKNRPVAPDTLVSIAQRWEDVMVIVAGGAGKHSMWVPTFGATRSVTRAILKSDGSTWTPADFNEPDSKER
jgi:hypothetical protein